MKLSSRSSSICSKNFDLRLLKLNLSHSIQKYLICISLVDFGLEQESHVTNLHRQPQCFPVSFRKKKKDNDSQAGVS